MIETLLGKAITTIRIPLSGSIPIPKIIKEIIETPPWQRLLSVLQLSFAYSVYPGATHTRAEHSLGVFHLLSRYLERLRFSPGFSFSKEELRNLLVAGLVHDIGQGPYSHWMDELSKEGIISLPGHEQRARTILEEGKLGKILRREGLSPERISNYIEGKGALGKLLVNELDADRMDFLPRDSLHTGVPYGMGFDTERLLMALYWRGSGEKGHLAISKKGIHPLKIFFSGYEIMYEAVYLHKTVHALSLMMKEAMTRLIRNEVISRKEIARLPEMTDWEFLAFLSEKSPKADRETARLLTPFLQRKREIVKLALEIEVEPEKMNEIVSRLRKALDKKFALVGAIVKKMPDLRNIVVVEGDRERKLSEFAKFVPSGPISLVRVYAFREEVEVAREAARRAVGDAL